MPAPEKQEQTEGSYSSSNGQCGPNSRHSSPGWAAYRWLWTDTPVVDIITKGSVVWYSLLGMVMLVKQDLSPSVNEEAQRALNITVVTVLLLCTAEALVVGLAGEASFMAYVERPVRRLLLAKWALFQVETFILAASLASVVAAFIYIEVFLDGIAVELQGVTPYSHSLYIAVWMVLLGRILHSVLKQSTFRTKKAIVRLRRDDNIVTSEHLVAALDTVPGIPASLYLQAKGLIEELFEAAHGTSSKLQCLGHDASADLAEVCAGIMHPERNTTSPVGTARRQRQEKGDREARMAVCLALMEEAEARWSKSWAAKVNEIVAEVPAGAYGTAGTFAATFGWLGRHWALSALMICCISIGAVTSVLRSVVIGSLAGTLARVTPETTLLEFVMPGFYMGLVVIANRSAQVVANATSLRLKAEVLDDISRQMFSTVCGGRAGLSDGDLIGRFARDSTAFGSIVQVHLPWHLIYPSVALATSMIALFMTSWQLAVVFLLCIPAGYPVVSGLPLRAHKDAAREQSGMQAAFNNCVALQRVMALYDAGDFVRENAAGSVDKAARAARRAALLQAVADAFVEMWAATFLFLAFIDVMITGFARMWAGGEPSNLAASTTTAVLLIFEISYPTGSLARGISAFNSVAASLWRIDGATGRLDQGNRAAALENEDEDEDGLSALPLLEGVVTYNGVEFAYPGAEKRILKGINATCPAGSITCIVGFSGAGKSTMLYLLTREHTETAGSICMDSVPLSGVPVKQVRKQIGVVLQESTLLNGTLADNIRLGRPEASQAQVEEAARRAECHDFIAGLPNGYETRVGEDGDTDLSGGQRQRICVARALCRQPRLLILDEATSALDPSTEGAIIGTVTRLSREEGLSVVSVTHRMATTDSSDQVIVLKDGQIVESGPQVELLARKGAFHTLYTAGDTKKTASDGMSRRRMMISAVP